MKQTAIEWLFKWMIDNKDSIIEERLQAFNQAKAMEKEQIKKAWINGNYNIDSNGNPSENYAISDENYYNKTFKSEI